MAFKLKFQNVQSTGKKATPFKQNQALISGAGAAGATFSDPMMAYKLGSGGGSGMSTAAAEEIAESKNCVEQGLTGEALKKCQDKTNKDYLNTNKDPDEDPNNDPKKMSYKEFQEKNPDATRDDYRKYKEDFEKTQKYLNSQEGKEVMNTLSNIRF